MVKEIIKIREEAEEKINEIKSSGITKISKIIS